MLLLHAHAQGWLDEPDELRDHPGARQRRPYQPVKGKRKAMTAGGGAAAVAAIPKDTSLIAWRMRIARWHVTR
jgi:hypothetical protein